MAGFTRFVRSSTIEHRKYETGLGDKLESDISLVVNYLGSALRVFVENKSQQKSGSAIEKILDRVLRMEAVSFFNSIPVLMVLDVRNQNLNVLNRIEAFARLHHVAILYRQDMTEESLELAVSQQMHFLSLHALAKATVLAQNESSEEDAITMQYDQYAKSAKFQGRCKEDNFIQ